MGLSVEVVDQETIKKNGMALWVEEIALFGGYFVSPFLALNYSCRSVLS